MSKTVTDYQNDITNAQNEIAKLQKSCSHPQYKVVMYSYRVSSFYPTRMCTDCQAPIEGTTPEEVKTAWKEWYSYSGGQTITAGNSTISYMGSSDVSK